MTSRTDRFDKVYTKFTEYSYKSLLNNAQPSMFQELDMIPSDWLATEHDKVCTSVRDRLQAERNLLNQDERFDLLSKLTQLDNCVAKAKAKNRLPSGSVPLVPQPQQVLRAHAIKLKLAELRHLRAEEEKIKDESRQLMAKAVEKRERLEAKTKDINADIQQFQEAVATSVKIPVDGLIDSMAVLDDNL